MFLNSLGAREYGNSRVIIVFEYGGAFRLNTAKCKKNNLIKKPIFNCLPNLQETLIESSKFPIGMSQNKGKVKKMHSVERN